MSLTSISALFHELSPLERVTLGTRAPAAWLVTGEDRLRLTVRNNEAAVTVRVSGRFLTADGTVVPIVFDLAPAADLSASATDYALGDGWVLGLTARVLSGAPQLGQTFLTVDIVRGSGAVAVVLGTLIAGYITAGAARAWPGSALDVPQDGPGRAVVITGADPAAGAEISVAVPTGIRLRLRGFIATLVADATVANRDPSFLITSGGTLIAITGTVAAHTAGQTRRYSGFTGAVRNSPPVALDISMPTPPVDLRAGDTLTSLTSNLQVGDNWGAPSIYGEAFLDV